MQDHLLMFIVEKLNNDFKFNIAIFENFMMVAKTFLQISVNTEVE